MRGWRDHCCAGTLDTVKNAMIEGEMSGVDNTIRASDAERDAVVETLRRHTADGRLTMAEFEDRVAEAFAARTRGDLGPVLRELPPLPDPHQDATRRRRRPNVPARLPQIAIMAIVAVAAIMLIAEGMWWLIFPFFWMFGGMFGGMARGGACGRQREARHGRHTWHEPEQREQRETVRV